MDAIYAILKARHKKSIDHWVVMKATIADFRDEHGCVGWKDIPRLEFVDYLFEFLPLIEVHNKQCQNILNLERCWPTRINWFPLLTSTTGVSAADFHRLYLNEDKRGSLPFQEYGIRKFSDMICHSLAAKSLRPWYRFFRHSCGNDISFISHLVPITDKREKKIEVPQKNKS
eukprot:10630171-Ditylum_brightwellii.AAC.1